MLRILVGGIILALGLAEVAIAADSRAGFADRVPAKACLAVFSSDVAQTCDAFQKTRFGETLCGPDFKPLIAELTRLDLASPMRLRPSFGFDWSDLTSVRDPGGVVIFPLPDGTMGVAWLFISDKEIDQVPPNLAAAASYFKQKGYRESSVKRTAGGLTVLTPPTARPSESTRVLFVAKEFYGVANSQATADAVLNVTADQSLAAGATFKKLVLSGAGEKSTNTADVSFFLRPIELLELMQTSEGPASDAKDKKDTKGKQDQKAAKGKTKAGAKKDKLDKKDKKKPKAAEGDRDDVAAARRLGWDGVQAIAGQLNFDAADPSEWQLQATLHAPRPYRGALRMLNLQSGPMGKLPPWIPAGAISVGSWQWDFPLAMQGFGNLFDEANEPGPDGEGLFEDMLDGLRDDAEGVQVDLRRDLFDRLAPTVLSMTDAANPKTAGEPGERRWLYVAGVRDAKTVLDTLTRFYKGDDRVHHARLGPYDVWTVGEGASLFVEGESDSLVTVRGLALGEGQLLFSTHVDLLNSAIGPPAAGPKLQGDAAWTRLLDWIKGQENQRTALRTLLRLDQFLEPSYQSATKEQSDEADDALARLWRLLLFGTSKGSAGVSYSAVPKFDRLRSALPPSAMVMSQTDDGWTIRFGVLRSTPSTPR